MEHEFYIKRALRLAQKARGMTSPNPMVGSVIVKDGQIVSEDFHRKPGTPHAEALAIERAGQSARGATLYVNLEPCCHTEKRTPPCTKAIVAAGIEKVIISMKDPNPKVAGRGIEELRSAGIEVISGILEDDAKRLNEAYVKYISTKRPFVILKTAMTLDGKIATPEGQSQWITGEKARRLVHRTRSAVDAIMTAIGTVKADNPRFTARIRGGKNPLRVVVDPRLEISPDSNILRTPPETLIVTSARNSKSPKSDYILKSGSKIMYFEEQLDLDWLMKRVGEMGVTSLLIEGGSSLNSHALEDGIVDKVMFFMAPILIGGKESFPAIGGKTFRRLEEAHRVRDVRIRRIGEDFLIEGYLK